MTDLVINDIYDEFFIGNEDRYYILIGGRGSGKSYAAAQKLIIRCLKETGHRILILRKTLPALKRSCWTLVNSLLSRLSIPCQINKTEMNIIINGNTLMFISLDDPEKIKSIEGITSVWVEEASELNESEFKTIDLILRGQTRYYKQIIITLNPINELLWVNKMFCYDINLEKEFYKRDEKTQRTILKTTYQDNHFIDEEYKNILINLQYQNKNLYRISALGVWGGNKGIIYNNYVINSLLKECSEIIYGLDFGFNNPTALIQIGKKDNEYYIKQLIYESGLTNNDLIAELKRLEISKNNRIYCDCAEPARIEELKRSGFNVWEAEKNISDGIDYVKSQFLHIEESSTDVIKEIKTYSWQEKKDGSIIDVPVKEWDHAMDAMRYAIYTHTKKAMPLSPLIGAFEFTS